MKLSHAAAAMALFSCVMLNSCVQDVKPPSVPAGAPEPRKIVLKTDPDSIIAGRALFNQRCAHCHYVTGDEYFAGPSLSGILKRPLLPVSNKPTTPENIVRQMRHPYTNMPSFVFLSEEDLMNILAYLNTL